MTPEDYKTLKENCELWDSLSDCLKTQFAAKFPYSETLQNTSNASSHIGLLEEESKEMVIENNIKTFVYKCLKCGGEPFGHFEEYELPSS